MRVFRGIRGQSTAEYVIVLGLIVAAVVAMQTYIKRGFNARIKNAVDYTDDGGTGENIFTTRQYEPYYMKSDFERSRESTEGDSMAEDGAVARTVEEETSSTGYQEQTAVVE